jgi:transcription antitermination factor NusG
MKKILILSNDGNGRAILYNYRAKKKSKSKIAVGDKVNFISGNFKGLTGEVKNVDFKSTNPKAIYGFYHEVLLSDGRTGFIEKGEHWEFL